jgi:hypothetical protein
MKFSTLVAITILLALASILQADVVLGAFQTEPGVPIAGEEDIAIYNLTGAAFGCSTTAGTPICTPVTFDDLVLTVNDVTAISLGDVGPRATESLTFPNGTVADGTITSLSVSFSLSATSLVGDHFQVYDVASGNFYIADFLDARIRKVTF